MGILFVNLLEPECLESRLLEYKLKDEKGDIAFPPGGRHHHVDEQDRISGLRSSTCLSDTISRVTVFPYQKS